MPENNGPASPRRTMLTGGTQGIVRTQIPMHHLGDPKEVARTILFLCSPEASYINGAEIHVNGSQHV